MNYCEMFDSLDILSGLEIIWRNYFGGGIHSNGVAVAELVEILKV